MIFYIFSIVVVFHIFSTLELKNKKVGPKIRIICEISSLEPAPTVWNPMYRSPQRDLYLCIEDVFPSHSRFPEGFNVRNPFRGRALELRRVKRQCKTDHSIPSYEKLNKLFVNSFFNLFPYAVFGFPWGIEGPGTGSEARAALELDCVQRCSKTDGSVPGYGKQADALNGY